MNVYSISFSPTGTTAKIADMIVQGLMSAGSFRPMHYNVTKDPLSPQTFNRNDAVIFAVPVYGGRMAPLARLRMQSLRANNTPCAIVAVYGNRAFENALIDMSSFVHDCGFIPIAAAAFVGEHSYSTEVTPIASGRPDADDLSAAKEFGRLIAPKLLAESLSRIDASQLHDLPSSKHALDNFHNFIVKYKQLRLEKPVNCFPEVDMTLCNSCGLCITVCPSGAIGSDYCSIDTEKCLKCCACVKLCPSGARSLHSPFAKVLSTNFSIRKSPVWIIS